jgi:hypothetical protein
VVRRCQCAEIEGISARGWCRIPSGVRRYSSCRRSWHRFWSARILIFERSEHLEENIAPALPSGLEFCAGCEVCLWAIPSGARGLWGFACGVIEERRSKWLWRLGFNFACTAGVPHRSGQNSELCPARLAQRSRIAGRFVRGGVQNSLGFASGEGRQKVVSSSSHEFKMWSRSRKTQMQKLNSCEFSYDFTFGAHLRLTPLVLNVFNYQRTAASTDSAEPDDRA